MDRDGKWHPGKTMIEDNISPEELAQIERKLRARGYAFDAALLEVGDDDIQAVDARAEEPVRQAAAEGMPVGDPPEEGVNPVQKPPLFWKSTPLHAEVMIYNEYISLQNLRGP